MNLLLDANISYRVGKLLSSYEVFHVDFIGLKTPAKDTEIWDYAKANDMVIVTNDIDFLNLAVSKGSPPKVVLLQIGNQKTKVIADILEGYNSKLLDFLVDPKTDVYQIQNLLTVK